jgi:hypothetical protein
MIKFRQQATYISNGLHFVDRSNYFKTKEDAKIDLERFACRTHNRISNQQYKCVVFEDAQNTTKKHDFNNLVNRM